MGDRWYSNNRQVKKLIDKYMGRNKRMAMSGMTVSGAMGKLSKIPKGAIGSVELITTPIYIMYQASKITRKKGEQIQLQVKNNLIVIKRDSIKTLMKITEKLRTQDQRANITLKLEEICALVGGIRAESQETEHLIATLKTNRNWKIRNLWSEYYTDMIKNAQNKAQNKRNEQHRSRTVHKISIKISHNNQ